MAITISYGGSTIASILSTGQKTLKTCNRHCTSDIIVTSSADSIVPIKDGKTRLYIDIPLDCDLDKATIPLYWNQSVENGVLVDWGDGSSTFSVNATGNVSAPTPHRYATGGSHTIIMTVVNGCSVMLGNGDSATGILGSTEQSTTTHQRGMLKAIEIGRGVTALRNYCFCRSGLEKVIFGPDVTTLGSYALIYAYNVGSLHFLGDLPSTISSTGPFSGLPERCKIYVPSKYFNAQGIPQNITSNMPSTSTYTYVVEPDVYED